MNIYVDESGSFVNSPTPGSWNVVAALTAAETGRKVIAEAVCGVRRAVGAGPTEEVKLNRLEERAYRQFLDAMKHQDVAVFATATDAGLNSIERILRHQSMQVANIREGIPRMRYEGGRLGVELLASQMESISPQLYVQLVCQVNLLHDVVTRAQLLCSKATSNAARVPVADRSEELDSHNFRRCLREDRARASADTLDQGAICQGGGV